MRTRNIIKNLILHQASYPTIAGDLDRAVERIKELEQYLSTNYERIGELLEHIAELESTVACGDAGYNLLLKKIKAHVADLRKTADTLEAWQDPMVGPFDATIAEIRKAADELEALEQK